MADRTAPAPPAPWFVVLPDSIAAERLGTAVVEQGATSTLWYPSGRPWVVGAWPQGAATVVAARPARVALLGACLAGLDRVVALARQAVAAGDLDRLARLPGSYHLLVAQPGMVGLYTDVAGLRRAFHARVGQTDVAASHALVLARLTGAEVAQEWLALRLLVPSMPTAAADMLAPWPGIRPIPPGCRYTAGADEVVRIAPYWAPPAPALPLAVASSHLRAALGEAVGERVRRTDGRVTIELSGGMDSTAISFLAHDAVAGRSGHLTAFTLPATAPGNEDVQWAVRAAAAQAATHHVVFAIQQHPALYSDLDQPLPLVPDEPSSYLTASGRVRRLAERAVAAGSGLHLNGQGGDEVLLAPLAALHSTLRARPWIGWRHLAGYRALHRVRLADSLIELADRRSYRRWLAGTAATLRAQDATLRRLGLGWEPAPLLPPWTTAAARDAMRETVTRIAATAEPSAQDRSRHATLVRIRAMARISRQYADLLGAFGLTVHFPYLDRAVVEACLSARDWERTTPWQAKPLLAEAMSGIVPAELLTRRTKSHYNADARAGIARHRATIVRMLTEGELANRGLIEPDTVRALLPETGSLGVLTSFVAETLGCELWLRQQHDRGQYVLIPNGRSPR